MFYNRFCELCAEQHIAPTTFTENTLKMSKGNVSKWKDGKPPKSDTVQKIAAYFGVSTDYLLGNTDIKNKPAATEDDELLKNPEMREALIWFRSHSPEDQKRALNLLKALDIPPEPPKDK
ncbi:helix-turn-helix domain-containing protein [Anaerotruncus rubiinfantis]|uniref:helix-turn-helix domain-containing protein n=1 Tax=Anaerotruncus rubiinfantis TaxID=1720200 RepID=UPI003D7B4046